MTAEEAKVFCEAWLPAWTGNRPADLLEFYAPDAFYRDPAHPEGLAGRENLRACVEPLLARFPLWTWTADEIIPALVRDGKIVRNEVFFDSAAAVAAIGGAAGGR